MSLAPAGIILAVALLLVGGYMGAYLLLSEHIDVEEHRTRIFSSQWEAQMFRPAAWIESLFTGLEVGSTYDELDDLFRPDPL